MSATAVSVINHHRRYHAERAPDYPEGAPSHSRLSAHPFVLQIARRWPAQIQERKSVAKTAELEQRMEQQRTEIENVT